jgi:molybdenum cofactor biosynthesis enzyme MoaA
MIIPIANQHSYNSIPRNAQLGHRIDYHCNAPSRQLVVDWKGDCFVCGCEAWLPISPGKITDFEKLADVWTHPTSAALQKDIDSGKFTHCAVDRCGVLAHNQRAVNFTGRQDVTDCYYISINIDDSCNLACPSCRPAVNNITEGPEFEHRLAMVNHLVGLLEQFDRPTHIVMSGNGDPLASSIMRPLLHRYRPVPGQTLRLFTNGLLLAKQLEDNPIIDNISQYFVSVDAGSETVYQQVRQPGRWDVLLKNFDFLRKVVDITGAEVLLKFVLQAANYKDMENFVLLCEQYRFQGVINRLEDWGTWANFEQQDCIGNPAHPAHSVALAELRRVYQRYHRSLQFNPSLKSLCQTL